MTIVRGNSAGIGVRWNDGVVRIVPLMTPEEMERFWPVYLERARVWQADPESDCVTFPLEVFHTVVRRRYPSITLEEIAANIVEPDLPKLWRALWEDSSLLNIRPVGETH